jgi:hypothetical protein
MRRNPLRTLLIPVAPGELLDKLTILQIKATRITGADKLAHLRCELADLAATRDLALRPSGELERWIADLRAINETQWEVEDALRDCERRQGFGAALSN